MKARDLSMQLEKKLLAALMAERSDGEGRMKNMNESQREGVQVTGDFRFI